MSILQLVNYGGQFLSYIRYIPRGASNTQTETTGAGLAGWDVPAAYVPAVARSDTGY